MLAVYVGNTVSGVYLVVSAEFKVTDRQTAVVRDLGAELVAVLIFSPVGVVIAEKINDVAFVQICRLRGRRRVIVIQIPHTGNDPVFMLVIENEYYLSALVVYRLLRARIFRRGKFRSDNRR